ncbi:tail assembly chaperone [uncultured Vagococcus sp.]|uniref:tail assembly chaperone n=1 Tax=uncultured Vagococcus sp. TaxID=189676 RepID=UPI0028D81820|nr:tail assembly chaperone [uncultured Vagococcus sp.]
MKLVINKKTYSFKFGTKFVREIDKRLPLEQEGIKFGFGLSAKVVPELQGTNVNTLSNVLYMANLTEEELIEQDEIDDYIDEVEDIEALFDQVMKELAESNAGKLAMRNLNESLKKNKK